MEEELARLQKQKDELDERVRLEIVAEVFEAIQAHMNSQGSFRYLIYNRLGFTVESGAYVRLLDAGGLEISNMCFDHALQQKEDE